MVAARRSSLGTSLFAAVVGSFALKYVAQLGFANYSVRSLAPAVQLRASYEESYPNLVRVESMIQESCAVKDGEAELNCLRMYDKLTKFHEATAKECDLDNLKCIVLEVLERLCGGIESGDGTVILNRVSSVVSSLRGKFTNWDAAFANYDTDNSGDIDMAEMSAMMKALKVGLSEKETAMCFFAADANGDGVISREEFSNFMTAAVFAEDTLDMEADPLPKKMKSTEDFLLWATSDRDGSWGSSLAPGFR
jgi:hypothetical protein